MSNEVRTFLNTWNEESQKTVALLNALPTGQYDFRPDAGGRSVGELAWHLAEIEAYTGFGLERGAFEMSVKPPGFERPQTVEEIAIGYQRIHSEAMTTVAKLTPADLDRKLLFFTGEELPIREILWAALLHHHIHHRGQLSVLCRLAGGIAPAPYGPNREQMAVLREKMAARG